MPPVVIPEGVTRKVKVRCGEVELQLTLTKKFLARPFTASVIGPFLGAFSKKVEADPPVTAADVATVLIDGVVADPSLSAAELLPIAPFTWVEITLGGSSGGSATAATPTANAPSPESQDWHAAAAEMFALSDEDMRGWVLEQVDHRIEESLADRAVGDSAAAVLATQVAESSFSMTTSTGATSRACVFFPKQGLNFHFPATGLPLILLAHPAECHARHPWYVAR